MMNIVDFQVGEFELNVGQTLGVGKTYPTTEWAIEFLKVSKTVKFSAF